MVAYFFCAAVLTGVQGFFPLFEIFTSCYLQVKVTSSDSKHKALHLTIFNMLMSYLIGFADEKKRRKATSPTHVPATPAQQMAASSPSTIPMDGPHSPKHPKGTTNY